MSETTTDAPKFRRKKILTLSTFKFEVDKPRYLLVLDKMHIGRKRGKPRLRPDGTEEEPPTLTHVIDMETGEHGQIMVAEIIKTELTETYPNDGYVGLAFAITKQRRKEGKRYDPFNIEELDVPENLQPAADDAIKALKASMEADAKAAKSADAPKPESSEAPAPSAPGANAPPTHAGRARR